MNKNSIVIGIVAIVIGLIIGWLVFGGSTETSMGNSDSSEMSDNHDHSEDSASATMWTCSMHPQIMQPEAGDCPICGMDLIPAETSAEGLAANEIKMTENAMALANIQTTVIGNAKSSDDEGMISLSGKIVRNEENNTVQASYFEGRIERLNINFEGQEVSRGQLLATIYSPKLVAAQQELITAASLKESQPALYQAVRNKLKNWKLSESQINTIEQSGTVRANTPIFATVSGTVSQVLVSEGDYVKQGQSIVKLSNLNTVWASFDAYEHQISQFKKGQKIKITTNAYSNKEFDASISFIDPVLNTATRTVGVRATLSNRDDLFKPGMFVTGKLKAVSMDAASEMINIPATAVLWTGERSLVYIKTNPDAPVFEMREVTLGNRVGDNYQVSAGIENGDEIVTNGTFTVDAAAQLQGKKSMMNKGKKEVAVPEMSNMKMDLPAAIQKELQAALTTYLKMKDAFVATDAAEVSAFAKALAIELKSINASKLGSMEQSHFKHSIKMVEAITENASIDNQRDHFIILNENMVALAMNIQELPSTIYVQRCPMANNNQGAIWLSMEKDIRNPYYGDEMLTCGSVIDSIQ
tara:strand:+ start:2159 stop:3910 length:1752 start_codon:yes stop_codon:yes gene_type:complete